MNSKRAMAQLLQHLAGTGVTHLPLVTPPKPSPIPAKQKKPLAVSERPLTSAPRSQSSPAPKLATNSDKSLVAGSTALRTPAAVISASLQPATDQEVRPEVQEIMGQSFADPQQKKEALCALAKSVASCRCCTDLAEKRTQTVFGVGSPAAEIMFIGEAPGAEEDAKGEPFVGPAGQLLNKIIEAMQLKRDDLYICNILRCRPPGNRNPLPQEALNCREFLDAQIHVVQPKYIVCWGTIAAQNLLNETKPVGKLRGQFFDYRGIKVLCTYHPSYLLRTPSAKKQVWEDMKFFMKHRGVELQ